MAYPAGSGRVYMSGLAHTPILSQWAARQSAGHGRRRSADTPAHTPVHTSRACGEWLPTPLRSFRNAPVVRDMSERATAPAPPPRKMERGAGASLFWNTTRPRSVARAGNASGGRAGEGPSDMCTPATGLVGINLPHCPANAAIRCRCRLPPWRLWRPCWPSGSIRVTTQTSGSLDKLLTAEGSQFTRSV